MTTPNTTTAVIPKEDKSVVEFTPFGEDQAIKLTVSIVKNLIAIPTKSKQLPTDNECMKFMMLCRSRALNPFEGDAFLQGYDGKDGPQFSLITAHQAFLKRAEVHPEFDGFESGVIVLDGDKNMVDRIGDFTHDGDTLIGSWCTVHFKNRKHAMKKRLKLATFNQGFGRWQKDAAGMIVKCAEADGLRSSFPTKIGGMYLREEVDMVDTDDARFKAARPARVSASSIVTVSEAPTVAPVVNANAEGTDNPGDNVQQPQGAGAAEKVAPVKEAAAAPKAEEKPVAPAEGDVLSLSAKIKSSAIPEHTFSLWLSNRYKLAPTETVAELSEIAPKRVANANANFDKLLAEFKVANPNS